MSIENHINYVKKNVARSPVRRYNRNSMAATGRLASKGVDGMIVAQILLTVFLSEDAALGMVASALYLVGLWKLFKKSGIKGWWALVPFARLYLSTAMSNPSTFHLLLLLF